MPGVGSIILSAITVSEGPEAKKLVRRERPSDDRRQVLCYVTKARFDLLSELNIPLKNQASELLRRLSSSRRLHTSPRCSSRP
jgi:hypothetical protein